MGITSLISFFAILNYNGESKPTESVQLFGPSIASEKQQAFLDFIMRFGKTYATKSDMDSRFSVFSVNFDKVADHNAQQKGFSMEINEFSDLTQEEFETMYGLNGLN